MDKKRDKESNTAKIKTSRRIHARMKEHYIHGNVPEYMRLYLMDKGLRVGH